MDLCCNGYVDAVTARNLSARSVRFTLLRGLSMLWCPFRRTFTHLYTVHDTMGGVPFNFSRETLNGSKPSKRLANGK